MKKSAVIVVVCLSLVGAFTPARAADLIYVSGPGEQFRGYTQPVLAITVGDNVTYANFDINSHDVIATQRGPDGPECTAAGYPTGTCPKFFSALIAIGQTSPIHRIGAQAPGLYPFYCSLHGAMKGTLVVLDA